MQLLLLVAGGLAVGASLGFLGGGGTILTVPILLLAGVPAKPAIALSLAVVAVTAAVAALGHARGGRVDWRAATFFGAATALGGFAGGWAARFVEGETLLLGFTALMFAAGVAMLRPRRQAPAPGGARIRPRVLAAQGTVIGAVTGLVGAGGGFLFVPAFVLLGGLPMQRAVGTSLVVITVNSLAALAGQLGHVTIPASVAAPITASAALGAWGGVQLGGRVSERGLRRAFGVLVLLVALWMLARSPWLARLAAAAKRLAAAVALLAVAAAAPAAQARVIVFGVDGACWPILDAGIARGELPNFAAVAARGVTAEMETVEPVISPTVWTSIATGRSPDAHGVTDFFRNRTHVRVPTVFERLARRGLRVGLQEWLVTWPPRTLPNGFVIPDWLRRDERVSPADLFTRAGLTPYRYSMQDVRSLAEFDANAKREVAGKPRLFLALARAFELDVAALSFYSVDATSHRFWRAAFPDEFQTPRTLEEEGFEATIRDTYRGVDAALGAVTASLAPEDSIVVVSDHGFRPEPATRRIWSLRLLDDPARLGLDPVRDGFEIDGEFMAVVLRVLPGPAEKREAIVSRLTATLESIRAPGGEAVLAVDVLAVAERPPQARGSPWQRVRAWGLGQFLQRVYGVKLNRPAYAVVLARPVDAELTALWPGGELEIGERLLPVADLFRVDDFTGTHDETAVFLAAGGPIAHVGARERLSVLDVAPLLLHLAGAPVPDDLERDVPVRLLDPARLAARPVRRVPAAELPGLPEERDDAAVDDAVLLERLRALGYVE